MKYVEWVVPYDPDADVTLICRLTLDDAVKAQNKNVLKSGNPTFKYDCWEHALEDFITVHWARIVED